MADDAEGQSATSGAPKSSAETDDWATDVTEARLETPAHGMGKLRRGNPGQRGGGRPPNSFKAAMRKLASRDATLRACATILRDPEHDHFPQVLKLVMEQGYGKPEAKVAVKGSAMGALDQQGMTAALLAALCDPAVRRWLEAKRPEVVAALAASADAIPESVVNLGPEVLVRSLHAATESNTANPPASEARHV